MAEERRESMAYLFGAVGILIGLLTLCASIKDDNFTMAIVGLLCATCSIAFIL